MNNKLESDISYIKQNIPVEDFFICLAEESSELAQAANKMVRAIRGINPVSKTLTEIYRNLIEEYTDVFIIAKYMLELYTDEKRIEYKINEWSARIKMGVDKNA